MSLSLSRTAPSAPPSAAFTLFEMMVALFVVASLVGLGVALVPRLKQKGQADRAAADIMVIQQALEAYRSTFGDYPRLPAAFGSAEGEYSHASDAGAYLFNALNGRIGPAGDLIDVAPMLNNALLSLENASLPRSSREGLSTADNRIVDPWGAPYRYSYPPQAAERFGYVLYSIGKDGRKGTEDDVWAK